MPPPACCIPCIVMLKTSLLAIICMILEVIIFIFAVVGTPIDAFRMKGRYSGPRLCYSMWGAKQCGNHMPPKGQVNKGFPCAKNQKTMTAAAALSIVSIFLTLLTAVMCILLLGKCLTKIVPIIFGIASFATLLIVWACQAGTMNQRCTSLSVKLSSSYNYAGSFGLFVTAWCLQTIVCVLMFLA